MKAYITSYLHPTDKDHHRIRFDGCLAVAKEWLANTYNLEIEITAMNWSADEIAQAQDLGSRIHIDLQPGQLNVQAKNHALRRFYSSTSPWAIVMDDDAMLYPHNSSYAIVDEMMLHIDDYKHIGAFYPHNPMMTGFNSLYREANYKDYHVFSKVIFPKGTMMFLRNFRYYQQEPVYFDEEFNMMEDVAFYTRLLFAGYSAYSCSNIVLKEVNHGCSYFNEDRVNQIRSAGHRIVDKYGDPLAKKKGGLGIDFRGLVSRSNHSQRRCIAKQGKELYTEFFDW